MAWTYDSAALKYYAHVQRAEVFGTLAPNQWLLSVGVRKLSSFTL